MGHYAERIAEHNARAGDPAKPGLDGLVALSTGASPGCRGCGVDYDADYETVQAHSEEFFSMSACDACGTTLGGGRHYAHGWMIDPLGEEPDHLVHARVCTACMLELNGYDPEESGRYAHE